MRRLGSALIVWSLMIPIASARQSAEPVTTGAAAEKKTAPPTAVLMGHVFLKDGITPVRRVRLVLNDETGAQFQVTTANSGKYKIRLPIGSFTLQIIRGADRFTSPSVYRVSAGVRNQVDLLIIPDFEQPAASDTATHPEKQGPDPAHEGLIDTGTIVDVVHEHAGGRWRRWAETLGFIGSMILVSLAAG